MGGGGAYSWDECTTNMRDLFCLKGAACKATIPGVFLIKRDEGRRTCRADYSTFAHIQGTFPRPAGSEANRDGGGLTIGTTLSSVFWMGAESL